MAGDAEKKRAAANAVYSRNFTLLTLVPLGVYLYSRFPPSGFFHTLFLVFLAGLSLINLAIARKHAANGGDFTIGGIIEYQYDLLYVMTGTYVLGSLLGDKVGMIVFSAIPIFAFYKLWEYVIGPWILKKDNAVAIKEEEARNSKKERKMERQERIFGNRR
jgi:hypothetical protein